MARGDLGVEMNPWDVPVIQKRIVETSKIYGNFTLFSLFKTSCIYWKMNMMRCTVQYWGFDDLVFTLS